MWYCACECTCTCYLVLCDPPRLGDVYEWWWWFKTVAPHVHSATYILNTSDSRASCAPNSPSRTRRYRSVPSEAKQPRLDCSMVTCLVSSMVYVCVVCEYVHFECEYFERELTSGVTTCKYANAEDMNREFATTHIPVAICSQLVRRCGWLLAILHAETHISDMFNNVVSTCTYNAVRCRGCLWLVIGG
jgi:hypothetical protein